MRSAILEFMESKQIDDDCMLILKTDELAVLHLQLAYLQEWFERSGAHTEEFEIFGRLRLRVETALSQAGYGGDPR